MKNKTATVAAPIAIPIPISSMRVPRGVDALAERVLYSCNSSVVRLQRSATGDEPRFIRILGITTSFLCCKMLQFAGVRDGGCLPNLPILEAASFGIPWGESDVQARSWRRGAVLRRHEPTLVSQARRSRHGTARARAARLGKSIHDSSGRGTRGNAQHLRHSDLARRRPRPHGHV